MPLSPGERRAGAAGESPKQRAPSWPGEDGIHVSVTGFSQVLKPQNSRAGRGSGSPHLIPTCGRDRRGSGRPSDPRRVPGAPWTPVPDVQQPDGPPQTHGLGAQDEDRPGGSLGCPPSLSDGRVIHQHGEAQREGLGNLFQPVTDGRGQVLPYYSASQQFPCSRSNS